MNGESTHTTIFSHAANPVHWRSTTFAAKFYGRTRRRIVQWCKTGRFASVNVPVFQDASRRWWICMDDSDGNFTSIKE